MTHARECYRQLHLYLADSAGIRWAQQQVTTSHYLHRPVDTRCSLLVYLVLLGQERVGTLIFGRPEAQRVNGWYGSVDDVAAGHCPLIRWQVLNLARIWLHPRIQAGGPDYIENAATFVIAQALRRVVVEYLLLYPPCFLGEPYELVDCLSYCDSRVHIGILYRAANFHLVRENERGIQTYARPLRALSRVERQAVIQAAQVSPRSRHYRAMRAAAMWQQGSLFETVTS